MLAIRDGLYLAMSTVAVQLTTVVVLEDPEAANDFAGMAAMVKLLADQVSDKVIADLPDIIETAKHIERRGEMS